MTTTVMADTVIANINSMGYDEWWCSPCGITPADCIAAYQAKGAGSYANSKINLANPGTYDADDTGHAPDWDDINGWKFDGIIEYLDTGISPQSTYTVICRYSNFIGADITAIFGVANGNFSRYLFFYPRDGINHSYYMQNGGFSILGNNNNGVVAISRNIGYFDGIEEGSIGINDWDDPMDGLSMLIGCLDFAGDSPSNFAEVYIQAFAMYNKTLTPQQIYDLTLAMQAL